jgi:hypothetical protein
MVAVMAVMLTGTAISLGALGAASGDIGLAENDVDQKRALAAAEAGLADYLQRLAQDNEVWLKCTNLGAQAGGGPSPVNQLWNGTGTDPRVWRAMATESSAAYTIELVPRAPYTQCQPNVDKSMMDTSGTIQLRVTGRAGAPGKYAKRALMATLRRNGFLDFLYFTEYETSDPVQLTIDSANAPVKRCSPNQTCPQDSLATWADQDTTCRRYVRDGRSNAVYPGSIFQNNRWQSAPFTCKVIQFVGADKIQGPFHTNDTMTICNSPQFGRTRTANDPIDKVEYYGYSQACGSGAPNTGTNQVITGTNLQILQLPQSNTQLRRLVDPAYLFTGQTTIVLNGTQMTVNGTTMPLPSNGIVYVANGASCPPWNPLFPAAAGQGGCGDALVQGTYGAGLTIATERDIVATGNITGSNNSLLGLIANNYVRVAHPMQSYMCSANTSNSQSGTQNRTIEAAILSLGHVFTVDNYQCGSALGTLTVLGAIAQKYRGPVGTGNGSTIVTGYIKNYSYDDRLRFRSPPHFMAPVQSAWRVVRSTELVPAR